MNLAVTTEPTGAFVARAPGEGCMRGADDGDRLPEQDAAVVWLRDAEPTTRMSWPE